MPGGSGELIVIGEFVIEGGPVDVTMKLMDEKLAPPVH
jgi:hypothetical protein